MSRSITGNTKGLAKSDLRRLDKLFSRKVNREEIVSLDLAREVYQLGSDLRRKLGVLVSREGQVEEVMVGTKELLYLPDLGRYRLGPARLRRLRLVFSDLSKRSEPFIPTDIYTDLEKLRLDMVIAVKVLPPNYRVQVAYAHIVPSLISDQPAVRTERVNDLGRLELNFEEYMQGLEEELSQVAQGSAKVGKLKALLVGVYGKDGSQAQSSLDELTELARTANVEIADRVIQRRDPDPRTVLGKGKLEEVVLKALRLGAELIIFDAELRPGQWRAITNATELKVLDRSMLILDIFAQRASSSDGRLQVELAQLRYNLPKLVEKDAGLSRLTGGIGGRGPGETKLEIGRRRIRDRISDLERRIDKLSAERQLRRQKRQESKLPLAAIIGYTNVGKSTLFNVITGSSVVAEDKLFATLDPAKRKVVVPGEEGRLTEFVLSDTVGFIRNLPEELRNAFRATLEELYDAALLLHVMDASDPEIAKRKQAVDEILAEMKLAQVPCLNVLNKIDLADRGELPGLVREYGAVPVSARTKEGIDKIVLMIAEKLTDNGVMKEQISLGPF